MLVPKVLLLTAGEGNKPETNFQKFFSPQTFYVPLHAAWSAPEPSTLILTEVLTGKSFSRHVLL